MCRFGEQLVHHSWAAFHHVVHFGEALLVFRFCDFKLNKYWQQSNSSQLSTQSIALEARNGPRSYFIACTPTSPELRVAGCAQCTSLWPLGFLLKRDRTLALVFCP